jgi:hypothetical protein
MVIAKPAGIGKNLHFSASADLCKEVSTKGNESRPQRGESLPSESALLTSVKLELAYFSGRAWQSREIGGAGVILRSNAGNTSSSPWTKPVGAP